MLMNGVCQLALGTSVERTLEVEGRLEGGPNGAAAISQKKTNLGIQ